MDYRYIEQLLESYWECNTTPEEEEVLRAFFRQSEMPDHLKRFRSLFAYEHASAQVHLGSDFDQRIMEKIGLKENNAETKNRVRAHRIPFNINMRPLYRAVAVLAIVLTLGNAAQHQFSKDESETPDYNYAQYKDTYTDPQVAFDEVSSALQAVSSGLNADHKVDSTQQTRNEKAEQ